MLVFTYCKLHGTKEQELVTRTQISTFEMHVDTGSYRLTYSRVVSTLDKWVVETGMKMH